MKFVDDDDDDDEDIPNVRNVKAFESCRLTDIHTDTAEILRLLKQAVEGISGYKLAADIMHGV